ncbi:MAG: signal recognition particle-docking protein FtsY [Chloroflexi bacterium B3_Chlor]|nr:MAG: signal recognition particle-docking protein FtsY [Chloroflexi bacterium B3_Chlor]
MFGRGKKIEQSLTRTRRSFFGRISKLLGQDELDNEVWQELEELLIQADVGVATTIDLVQTVRDQAQSQGLEKAALVEEAVRQELLGMLGPGSTRPTYTQNGLWVILVVGVNGSGKTTSIAKLARYHQQQGRNVLLAAADTFRAAAVEQLKIWGQRLGADVVAHQPGADPAAVVYDAIQAGQARGADTLIVDTAGRLHTKYNLMQELAKIYRVIKKQIPEAPQETLLVLDATMGQNALSQARTFKEAVDVNGIFLAKLDGTAKGGIVFAIAAELGIPIRYVGTGEGLDDAAEFDVQEFVAGLFEESSHPTA